MFQLDRGVAEIPKEVRDEFREDCRKFHPLSVVHSYLGNATENLRRYLLIGHEKGVYVVERRDEDGAICRMSFDESRGFSIKEITVQGTQPPSAGIILTRCEISTVDCGGGLWLPRTVSLCDYHGRSGKIVHRLETTFDGLKLNLDLKPNDLEIALPNGTVFVDHRTGVTRRIGDAPDQ